MSCLEREIAMERLALSIQEAAEALGVAPSTIRKMIAANQLPATRVGIGRGRFRIATKAIEGLLSGRVA